jgi:hypothetical protein
VEFSVEFHVESHVESHMELHGIVQGGYFELFEVIIFKSVPGVKLKSSQISTERWKSSWDFRCSSSKNMRTLEIQKAMSTLRFQVNSILLQAGGPGTSMWNSTLRKE